MAAAVDAEPVDARPMTASSAGTNVTAAATAMATVSELATAKPFRNSMPISSRPSSETTTVPPANTIARPLVRTAVAIALVDITAGMRARRDSG